MISFSAQQSNPAIHTYVCMKVKGTLIVGPVSGRRSGCSYRMIVTFTSRKAGCYVYVGTFEKDVLFSSL